MINIVQKITNLNLHICSSSLKHSYFGSLFVSDVLVDGEDEQEHKEEAGAAKEVPDVVPDINSLYFCQKEGGSPVVELEHLARPVQLPRFRWRHI